MALTSGTKLGPYQILSPAGAGGMGEVYRARDTRLDRTVAIKVLSAKLANRPDLHKRFEREARTISKLTHPHICALYDVGQQEGVDFLVMEYLEGETLSHRLQRGPLAPEQTLKYGTEIAEALGAAHRQGIIHRDLKPLNIMLTKAGAKLMDFGLAKLAELPAPVEATLSEMATAPTLPSQEKSLTEEGVIVGTFRYMAPEQLEGKEADARTDLFALGMVLYEMATGRPAFTGRTKASVIAAILSSEPPPISSLQPLTPPAFDRAVKTCLAKDPDERWQSAHDLASELKWIAEGGSQAGLPAPVVAQRLFSKRLLLVAAWVAALALVLGVSMYFAGRSAGRGVNSTASYQQVSYRPQIIFRALFAPDGKTVVFSAANEGTTPTLYTIQPEYPEAKSTGLSGVQLLSVSRRGELAVLTHAQYIAHRLFRGTLARMPLGSGAPREILDEVEEADWAPDGSELAIIREVGGQSRLEYPVGKVLYQTAGYVSDLRFSPHGDRIAFFDHPFKYDDRGSVAVVDLAGKKTDLAGGFQGLEGLAWSKDGDEIFFSGVGREPLYQPRGVTLSGKQRSVLSVAGSLLVFDVSPDGLWLVARKDSGKVVVVAKDPASGQERDLSWLDFSATPYISEDGGIVTFQEQGAGSGFNYAVCLRKTDGSPVVVLGEGVNGGASPDGRWVVGIVFTPPKLMLYPTGAGEARMMERGNLENYASTGWFPDNKRLLVCGNEPGRAPRCYLQELAGGAPQPVTPEGTTGGWVSPDGKVILGRTAARKFFLYPVGNGEPRPVAHLGRKDQVIRWGADGRSVLVFRQNQMPLRVEKVDLESGRRTLVRELAPADRSGVTGINRVSMSGDGNWYAYSYGRDISQLFTVKGVR